MKGQSLTPAHDYVREVVGRRLALQIEDQVAHPLKRVTAARETAEQLGEKPYRHVQLYPSPCSKTV